MRRKFKPGSIVVYRKLKHSACPGPRARDIRPSQAGESYSYQVDKFWVVDESPGEPNKLLLRTRRGKTHVVDVDDPNLRRPGWITRLLYARRFSELARQVPSDATAVTS